MNLIDRIKTHVVHQPFIFATGAAALVHSTWALGTLFSGEQPAIENLVSFIQWVQFAGWIVPAFLIAFALDVGQVVTSSEIRSGHHSAAKYVTFAVFAVATYYLQWLYIAHHMPELELAAGVRQTWAGAATFVRDCAIWIIPALLPASTLLYTFSGSEPAHAVPVHAESSLVMDTQPAPAAIWVSDIPLPMIEEPSMSMLVSGETLDKTLELELTDDLQHKWVCPDCGKSGSKPFSSAVDAARGLAMHKARHCAVSVPAGFEESFQMFAETYVEQS